MIAYEPPQSWIRYDPGECRVALLRARTAVETLKAIPYRRDWIEALQLLELKREVSGTCRLAGADFIDRDLDAALEREAQDRFSRSQRQARAAFNAYRWVVELPGQTDIGKAAVLTLHRMLIAGADEDLCVPGQLRGPDEQKTYGRPVRSGVSGGAPCEAGFDRFCSALSGEFRDHDPVLQALAAHYHLAILQPFADGNGRTARALEALLLHRECFDQMFLAAMSSHYYNEKKGYEAALTACQSGGHDLTPFFSFALEGLARQTELMHAGLRLKVQKVIYRDIMYEYFYLFKSPKKIAIAKRLKAIIDILLETDPVFLEQLYERVAVNYKELKNPSKAFFRDLGRLEKSKAIVIRQEPGRRCRISPFLDWPREITEAEFIQRIMALPKAVAYSFNGR